ncbi:OHCU decarboxylase [Chroococcidiopsis sp. CCALA 051]|uniref:2-oxo-4-hydroxy-4-carboxy-5-ureidoimidazoline decarboxylase n=1 Tax=Chroococcidiopsis sp. CCALA 051 TaxID=869949 RepID=UPI000D0CF0ED|nr:2-oxo-4-hydroxy-4-carboxy-5-ureidoimidazoline decarboxylase [Chroococcidiopsis sp. CCALA 051]MBE9016140.1 2-oxo-4-hydroxy-4-carboxy-5-ureidoimidazoline decarboxylase [Chroococcidiopsidales cyanobacterium LEGE 13417]PSM49776.1 OHCU decarboxylase [Chroococcidiopsis sp. CCALA 051]
MMISLTELNQMSQDEFVKTLGAVFEDTPAIAYHAWYERPFKNVAQLHQTMVDVVRTASQDAQIELIQAHPDLGSKAKMAMASVQEQAGAGLDRLTPEAYDRFLSLNQAYKNKFDFPFIIAVKNHTKDSILAAFEQRLQNSIETERNQALAEIFQIAKFRLDAIVSQ